MTQSQNKLVEIARTPADVLLLLTLVIIPPAALWFFTFEGLARWWSYISLCLCAWLAWCQFQSDNARTQIWGSLNTRVMASALLAWTPVFCLLIPGVIIAISCEVILSESIRYLELSTLQLHQITQDQVKSMVEDLEGREYLWWWPPDWIHRAFDSMKLDLLRSADDKVAGSGIILHLFFSCLYTVLRVVQLLSFLIIFAIVIRSFVHILFRVWLREGKGKIEFRLASCRTADNHQNHSGSA